MNQRLPTGRLPTEITGFVGRREELSEIRRLLTTTRLLTLTGVGGVGKTRLALRVAGQVRRSFADGVWLVELAGLQDPQLLPQAVSNALGVADQSAREQVEVLAEVLADRELLVVMDNCEHLLPAVTLLAVELLRAVPGLRVLATSREALQLPGEHVYPVAPLPVPVEGPLGAAAGIRYPAMALFTERAAAVRVGFALTDDNAALVAALCQRLDGIPLAIELAAARLRSLSLAQIVARLDDRFRLLTTGNRAALARHQTLRAAVEWSFELCTKPERLLWMRAAVFAGTFDLAAVERVCGGEGLPADEVLGALAGVVDKSVLTVDDDTDPRRYRLLDTLAQYGLDRLRDAATNQHLCGADEAVLRRRHRDFSVELAESFHADWFGPRQVTWSRRMRAELANLRAALGFCLAEEPRAGVRLAGALHYLWYACGQAREGRLWLDRVLAADPYPSRERVRALAARARIAVLHAQAAAITDLAQQGLDLARQYDEPAYAAEALTVLGVSLMYRDDLAGGIGLIRQGMELAAALSPTHPQLAYAEVPLAVAILLLGDATRAGELLADSERICRARGDRWYLGLVLFNSALRALASGDTAQARSDGRESLRLRQALNDTYGAASGLELLAWVAAADHDHVRAARLFGAAEGQWHVVGGSVLAMYRSHREARTAAQVALGDDAFDAEYRHGADLGIDDAIGYALEPEPTPAHQRTDQAGDGPRLTRRESEIAELVAQGLTNRQIAARLMISRRTVESHVENVLVKFGFTSRTQLAVWYAQQRPDSE